MIKNDIAMLLGCRLTEPESLADLLVEDICNAECKRCPIFSCPANEVFSTTQQKEPEMTTVKSLSEIFEEIFPSLIEAAARQAEVAETKDKRLELIDEMLEMAKEWKAPRLQSLENQTDRNDHSPRSLNSAISSSV